LAALPPGFGISARELKNAASGSVMTGVYPDHRERAVNAPRRTLGLAALAVTIVLAHPAPARAQARGERIVRYDVALKVGRDGNLVVRETIAYDFGSTERHGIIRVIPVRLTYDDRHDRIYPLEVTAVTASEGTPAQYKVENAGNNKRIKIGDPDRTITGRHTYTIDYRVEGTLNGFADHDELFWNAIGSEWSVPIEQASVTVEVPAPITQVACFAGPRRSALPCTSARADGRAAAFSGTLGPGEGLTVVVGFPRGVVATTAPVLDERWSITRAFAATTATVGVGSVVLLAVLAGFVLLVWRGGRDRRYVGSPVDVAFGNIGGEDEAVPLFERTETPVEFVPPDGLRPGQVGTLVDEVAHPLDVTATIIDLAVRGHLRIEEIPKDGWFGKPDWRLVRLDGRDVLRPYEQLLRDGLFRDGQTVELSELRNTFATRLRQVQDALYDDAVEHGWFVVRPDKVRARWLAIGITALILGIAATVAAAAFTTWALAVLPLAIGGLLLLVGHRWMPRRTAKGTGARRRALGFRRFIDESEKDRARFAEQQHLFSEYLPYAVVFGATEKWARAFAGLDGAVPQQSWYVSTHPFTVAAFSSSMHGFADTSSGSLISTPASSGSSGFGGGGFSGGGGGGGGGGSW
jgi:hypothetical protein